MAQSSCEAEMTALMDLANYTLSASYLAEELLQRKADKQLAGDNVAALSIYGGTAMHWRTRHLRIKAKAFMEMQKEGALPAHHVPGKWNAADIGTKALPASRHWKLCDLLGLRVYPEHRPVIRKTQMSNNDGSEQRLRALILACCVCAAKAQPGPQNGDAGVDRLLVIIILIVVTTIA